MGIDHEPVLLSGTWRRMTKTDYEPILLPGTRYCGTSQVRQRLLEIENERKIMNQSFLRVRGGISYMTLVAEGGKQEVDHEPVFLSGTWRRSSYDIVCWTGIKP